MPRSSPQTDRVVAVVNLLTERAELGATLTEIAAAVGQTPSALVHVLAALGAAGYVVRQPSDRRYRLGPALIAPGQVALGRFPALDETRTVVAELAQECGYRALAFQRDGAHARLVEIAGSRLRPAPPMRIGHVLPIDPPLGGAFVAWSGDGLLEEWLGRHSSPVTRDALRERLALARHHGFVVEMLPAERVLAEIARLLARGQQLRRAERMPRRVEGVEDYLAAAIRPRTRYEVATIGAPVVTDAGVDIVITLVGFEQPLAGSEVQRLGRLTRAAADRLAARSP